MDEIGQFFKNRFWLHKVREGFMKEESWFTDIIEEKRLAR